jgi:hypothetical protein
LICLDRDLDQRLAGDLLGRDRDQDHSRQHQREAGEFERGVVERAGRADGSVDACVEFQRKRLDAGKVDGRHGKDAGFPHAPWRRGGAGAQRSAPAGLCRPRGSRGGS